MRKKLETLMVEYGAIAVTIYFVIFGLVLAGFAAAIRLGVATEGVAADAGILGAAYIATKVTQPLRILATAALTPLVARFVRRSKPTS